MDEQGLRSWMEKEFKAVNNQIQASNASIRALDSHFPVMYDKFEAIDSRFESLEGRMGSLETLVSNHLAHLVESVKNIESRLDKLDK